MQVILPNTRLKEVGPQPASFNDILLVDSWGYKEEAAVGNEDEGDSRAGDEQYAKPFWIIAGARMLPAPSCLDVGPML